MTADEAEIERRAVDWAKANRTAFAHEITDIGRYKGEKHPVTVFMAGSPGAGKTEASKALMSEVGDFLRIDPDEFRSRIPEYNGSNSWLVQRAVSSLVERVLDQAFKQRQSFLLDGTLASYNVAERNIVRCLDRGRNVQVLYVYQEPELAWEFVRARELHEGRKIPPDKFVEQFFGSREVVEALKVKFSSDIAIDVLLKNNDGSKKAYYANVSSLAQAAPLRHTRAQVTQLISSH